MVVIAEAGRRIDAVDADSVRFPILNTELVRARLRDFLKRRPASALVCSAACGADLLALDEAGRLGLPRQVVLPFEPARFREVSVTDRPGDWGDLFDTIIGEVRSSGNLIVLSGIESDEEAFAEANRHIVFEATHLAAQMDTQCIALIVWDGQSRGPGDLTAAFADEARQHGCEIAELSTRDEHNSV